MTANAETFLAHYGVKGMRWGVRKDEPTSGRKPSYSIDKEGRITIGKGYQIQRVFNSKTATSGETGSNFFAFTKGDKQTYIKTMSGGIDSRFAFIRNMASDKMSVMVAKEPLKSPSRKEAIETMKATMSQVRPPRDVTRPKKDFSEEETLDWYQEALTQVALSKNSAFTKAYYGNLRKQGYNMLLDEMDAGFVSELPIIVLDGAKSLRPLSISDVSGKDVRAAKDFLKAHKDTPIRSIEELAKG